MTQRLSLLVMVVLTLCLQSCKEDSSSSSTKTELTDENSILVQNKLGEVRIPTSPKRVVVFDLGALDIFDEMGLGDNVVGIPKQAIPAYLNKYKDNEAIENTGSLIEPNFQRVNEANPDLIIIGGRQEKDFEEFSKIAPTLFYELDYEDYIGSISTNLLQIGKIFDLEKEAHAINEDMLHTIKEVAAKDTEAKGLFLMHNNGKFSAYGKGSRFGYIHDDFRVQPVSEEIESSSHGQSISSEYIQEMDPDYIFILDRNAAIGNGTLSKSSVENGLIKETKAYKNNHILYLSPQVWYLAGGGVQSIKMMAEEIGEVL